MIINSTNNHQMISKDKEKKDSIDSIENRIYYPNWDNSPPEQKSIVKWKDTHLLSMGGIMSLCAKAGVGKSSLMEAFISSHLNKDCDSLGVKIHLTSQRDKILICDTERSPWESHKAWVKLMKRASVVRGSGIDDKVIFANLKSLSVDEKKAYINNFLVKNNDVGLIIFDGASDFIYNTNDLVESNKFIEWVNTFNPDIALMFTIHTNPTDNKPRGHLGSELCRKSESVLLAKRDSDLFQITTDFEDGKNRHGKHESWNYQYCQDSDMFISADDVKVINRKISTKWYDIAIEIFGEKDLMSFSDIIKKIEAKTGKDYSKAKNVFFDSFQNKICLKKEVDGKPFWEIIRQEIR
jgi:hypothetical protein